ncbi:MAG TPA: RNA polymerase sigma factor [Acidobacteriaceae bacterium]|nr:RNA polymerase sigma factor [Acidobacteriaceae bacterium]
MRRAILQMAISPIVNRATTESWSDEDVVRRVLAGETGAYEIIMRRYNQRLYRVALSILKDESESEDVMQDTYLRAFEHLSQFAGRSKFCTWLTRIAVHEALARARRNQRSDSVEDVLSLDGELNMPGDVPDPERLAATGEMRRLIRDAVLRLPAQHRTVIMLRDVEGMSTSEAAEILEISEENLKVRLHRARSALRNQLYNVVGAEAHRAFAFEAPRCDQIVAAVFSRLADEDTPSV